MNTVGRGIALRRRSDWDSAAEIMGRPDKPDDDGSEEGTAARRPPKLLTLRLVFAEAHDVEAGVDVHHFAGR